MSANGHDINPLLLTEAPETSQLLEKSCVEVQAVFVASPDIGQYVTEEVEARILLAGPDFEKLALTVEIFGRIAKPRSFEVQQCCVLGTS